MLHGNVATRAVVGDPSRLRSVRRLDVAPAADEAFDRIAMLAERLIDAPVALVAIVGDDSQLLPGQIGLPEPYATTREMPLTHSLSRHVVEAADLLVVEDTRADARTSGSPSILQLNALSFAGAPVTDPDGLVVGALSVMDTEPRRWTASELALLRDLAAVCTSEICLRIAKRIADENRRREEEAHDQLRLLGEVTEAFAGTADLDDALGRLAPLLAGRLADWCFVALTDPSGAVRHVSAAHRDPAYGQTAQRLTQLARTSPPALRSLIVDVQRGRGVVRVDDADATALGERTGLTGVAELAERLGFGSYLAVPVTAPMPPRMIGALLLVNGPGRGTFGDEQARTAAELGRRAGLAVENHRLQGHQRHVAEVLQHSMLTDLPMIEGVELHARYLPAQAGHAVGGDWYDAFAQPDGSVILAVGDVSGHDIEAAATMGQVRNLVRGDAYGRDDPPGRLLAQLDRALHGLKVPAAATAVLARLRRAGDGFEITFANAGHPPPLMLRPDGEVEVWWESPEPLLGLIPRDGRNTYERRVVPGSTLLFYTDGLVELPARTIDEGVARLQAVMAGGAGLTADELCSRLIASAPRRADDIALLLVRLNEAG